MRILIPSIVDPSKSKGGAWTAARGLLSAIRIALPDASVEWLALPDIPRMEHRLRQAGAIAAAFTDERVPAKVRFTMDGEFRQRLARRLADVRPDLVMVNGSDLLWVLDEIPSHVPAVMIFNNVEHELYETQVRAYQRFPLLGHLLRRDLRALERAETSLLSRIPGAIFFSVADRSWAVRRKPDLDSILTPPVFDYEVRPRNRGKTQKKVLGMLADFTWWPNKRDLSWLCDNVLPAVEDRVELHLWGRGSERAAKGSTPLVAHGFVDDPRDAFEASDIMIAPAQSGAGVKVKVAEALFNRVPVIATPAAVRGLDLPRPGPVRVCADASEWISFLRSPGLEDLVATPVTDEAAFQFEPESLHSSLREFLTRMVS